MTREPLNEDRLRDAFHAEVAGVEPAGDESLDVIRRRGRAAIARRRAVVGGLGAVLLAGGVFAGITVLGDDDGQTVIVDPGPEETTTTLIDPTTTTPAAPSSTAPPAVVETPALWPPSDHAQYADPVETARSFVTEYVGFDDPQFGEVREAEPRLVEVDVLAQGEDGQVIAGQTWSTLHIVQAADGSWRVRVAISDAVEIESVDAGSDQVTVAGRGNGFEGTLNGFAIDADGDRLGEPSIITVECCSGNQPFESTIPVPERPASVLVISGTGIDGGSDFAAALTEAAGTAVSVFFVGPDGAVQSVPVQVNPPAVLNGSLAALLAGPSDVDQGTGLTSAIPAGVTAAAEITGGEATVDLAVTPGQTLPPDQAALAIEQLTRTVFQFPNITAVTFEVGGSCEDFGSWTGRSGDCRFERS